MNQASPPLIDQAARDFITGKDRKGLDHNIFVRAGAGAGKTHSIQLRVRNLFLISNIKPENLAVITYTTKAAAELKDRIRAIMEETATSGELGNRQKAIGVLDELNKAKISTVHSFCLDLLKEYPVEFDIDPKVEIADEMQSAVLEAEVQRQFLEAEMAKDPRFEKELEALCVLRDEHQGALYDDGLFRIFALLYANRDLTPRTLNVDGLSETQVKHKASVEKLLGTLLDDVFIGIEEQIKDTEDKLYKKCSNIRNFFGVFGIDGHRRTRVPEVVTDILSGTKNPFPAKAGSQGAYKSAQFLKDYKKRAQELDDLIYEFQMNALKLAYNKVVEIYPAFKRLYNELKREKGFLDFADCLILMRNSLRDNASLRDALQSRFTTIIVDEFQDSDPLQAQILFYLAAEEVKPNQSWQDLKPTPGMLLFVGDPKQSIFGFSRADIAIYLEVMNRIIKWDKEADRSLSTNFRSREGIVKFVNEHFSQIIKRHETEKFAAPDYEPMTAKEPDKDHTICTQGLDLALSLTTDKPGSKGVNKRGGLTVDEQRSREAWLIGEFVKEQIEKGRRPGDFLILFRKTAGMVDYERAFELLGIPVVNTKTRSFLQEPEVLPLLALVGTITDPTNTYFLYALLRSPFFGYTDQTLHNLLSQIPPEKRSLAALAKVEPGLQEIADIVSGSEGLLAKFEKACRAIQIYSSIEGELRDGFAGAALKLKEIIKSELAAHEYNESKALEVIMGGALKRFGSWGFEEEMEEEKLILQTERPSKVRLMTIHGAKGLEARFIILANPQAGTIKKMSILIDRTKDDIILLEERLYGRNIADLAELQAQVDREAIFKEEEEKRILYVAATRPIETLYLVRYQGIDAGEFFAPLANLLPKDFPAVALTIDEDYRKRYGPRPAVKTQYAPTMKETELLELQVQAVQNLVQRTTTSEAVTSTLKAEGEQLFRGNPDGRERGKEIGTLTHTIMEAICLRAAEKVMTTTKDLESLLDAANRAEYGFEPEEVGQIRNAIARFLESPLYRNIQAAEMIFPEVPFKVKGKVHGVVDLLYRDKDGLHLIDWKSDVFSDSEREVKVKTFYKKQIDTYVAALTEQLGEKVGTAECVYLF